MDLVNYKNCPCCDAKSIHPQLVVKDHSVSGENFEIWECDICSLRFTQNIPPVTAIGKYYQSENYISHTDTKKGFINSLYHLIRKRTLVTKKNLLERSAGLHAGKLLDIGAGTGAFCMYMKKKGWMVTGLEPDEATRRRAFDLHKFTLADTSDFFKMPSASFDIVTMWHVLEHVHTLHEYVAQVRKVLSQSGRAFIAVPNYTSFDASYYKDNWAAYDVPRHLYHFSPRSIKLLFEKHLMTLVDIKPMWYDSFYVSMLSERFKNGSPANVRAFYTGLLSNMKALSKKESCSSLIYVFRNK